MKVLTRRRNQKVYTMSLQMPYQILGMEKYEAGSFLKESLSRLWSLIRRTGLDNLFFIRWYSYLRISIMTEL